MILKVAMLLRQGLDQETTFTTEVVLDDEAQAAEAGEDFVRLALAFSGGIGGYESPTP